MTLLYTMIQDAADWQSLMSTRDLSRWFLDDELTVHASSKVAGAGNDDIYTEFGWNVEPAHYPVLAHIEAEAYEYTIKTDAETTHLVATTMDEAAHLFARSEFGPETHIDTVDDLMAEIATIDGAWCWIESLDAPDGLRRSQGG